MLCRLLPLLLVAAAAHAAEADALRISREIEARHMPYGTILDPVFSAPGGGMIVGYTRAGDSAIWTGHYLAAESFRYAVTRSPEALAAVKRALVGIRSLAEAPGTGLLARCVLPVDSPYAAGILAEEAHHGHSTSLLDGRFVYWIGNTSRDQYSGVFFGLALAYDLVDDAEVRRTAAALVTRLLDFLRDNNWAVKLPDGSLSTVFWGRADQQLALLAIGRHVNPGRFDDDYKWARIFSSRFVVTPVAAELLDKHNSYFKFNLDFINLFNLVRLEGNRTFRQWYLDAHNLLRRGLGDHGNAHFNMLDHGLKGPDLARDAETRELLDAWLRRPRFDYFVDLRGAVRECGENRACAPIPVELRVRTDFLWQRSPFQLYGGGGGAIEGPGIDYILPYWMARYYGVLAQ